MVIPLLPACEKLTDPPNKSPSWWHPTFAVWCHKPSSWLPPLCNLMFKPLLHLLLTLCSFSLVSTVLVALWLPIYLNPQEGSWHRAHCFLLSTYLLSSVGQWSWSNHPNNGGVIVKSSKWGSTPTYWLIIPSNASAALVTVGGNLVPTNSLVSMDTPSCHLIPKRKLHSPWDTAICILDVCLPQYIMLP